MNNLVITKEMLADRGIHMCTLREINSVVVLIGSSKFKHLFHQVAAILEKNGILCLMMGFFQHADSVPVSDEERIMMTQVDYKRIDLCKEVWVISVDNYVGESTRNEIEYASYRQKLIRMINVSSGE